LDLDSITWLESFLLRFPGTLLFVTHDRAFLRRLATRIVELDRGKLHAWACDYDTFLQRKEDLLQAEEAQREEFEKKLAREEAWIRKGIRARRTRNEGRVRALEEMRKVRRSWRSRTGSAKMNLAEAERSGHKVIRAENVSFAYEGTPLIRNFSTTIFRGDRIGIICPNGCGKSTLIRLLLKELEPDAGEVIHGTRLEIAYFDQHRAALDESKTLAENLTSGDTVLVGGVQRHVLGYLQDFLFTPDRARQKVSVLSGGERNRLLLAQLFAKPSNFLVLDEPTNDLDLETLELLEERLLSYEGTLLLVSHDREFLNRVVTSTLVFEGGAVNAYPGGYDDWLEQRRVVESSSATRESADAAKRKKTTRKLSNKEREELTRLPERIDALERELHDLQSAMSAPEFYRQPPEVIAQKTARAEAIPRELEEAFERWASLEEWSS
jgi:ATP-binding cassette subfamily F protein uup